MAYTPKLWQDRIKDSQGNIVQEGTPFSAGNMNHIEQGIADAHAQLGESARQTQTLEHGLSVLNGDVDAPVDVQIEGRTLIPMQNNVLDASKNYVIADKKMKLKWADGSITQGIAKFTGKAEQPTLIHVSNFENKVVGSTLENPHLYKYSLSNSLGTPSSSIEQGTQTAYSQITSLDGNSSKVYTTSSGGIAQSIFSFDIIQAIERKLGRIPKSTLADKIAWAKVNLSRILLSWNGNGTGPNGSKATLSGWNNSGVAWFLGSSHTNSTTSKLQFTLTSSTGLKLSDAIDNNGFVSFLAYADASDGVTPSTINTDYVELEIELVPGAILHLPRVPLYEVSQDEYNHILVDWLEDEVTKRYPAVEGVQHIQNPYVMAEGDNLIPPFSEWTVINSNFVINGAYDVTVNASSGTPQISYVDVPVIPNTNYSLNVEGENGAGAYIIFFDVNNTQIGSTIYGLSKTVTSPSNAKKARIAIYNNNLPGTFNFKNMIFNLGTYKPFVPRNPSYLFAEVKLGALNGISDRLYQQDGKYMVRKAVEKDVVLDGSLAWGNTAIDYTGAKVVQVPVPGVNKDTALVTKFNGKLLNRTISVNPSNGDEQTLFSSALYIGVFDNDTGFADTYTPTADEIKAYFNGWKVKTADPTTNKPTAWTSLFDGSDAPTQTLDYVKANLAPNFTPYKLSYVLASPVVTEVKAEGSISVNGLTQVEVGSGVIIREKVVPSLGASNLYRINDNRQASTSMTKYRVLKHIGVYKNDMKDNSWTTQSIPSYSNGMEYLTSPNFDQSADYYVTYIVYDRNQFTTNILNLIATYANSIRAALDDTEKKVEDNTREITVHANILYDILKRLKAGGM